MHFYTYYSYELWGRGYIGYSSCSCEPIYHEYLGSYHDKTFLPTEKIILAEHSSRNEAIEAEIKLHEFFDVVNNPHFANRAKQTSTGFKRGPYTDAERKARCGNGNPMFGKKHKGRSWKNPQKHRDALRDVANTREIFVCPTCGKKCKGAGPYSIHLKIH